MAKKELTPKPDVKKVKPYETLKCERQEIPLAHLRVRQGPSHLDL